jgi:hypothetical protein
MKEIKTQEALILEINTEIFMDSLPSNHRYSEVRRANRELERLYSKKDQVAKDLNI